jgi:hypothetical protein
MAEPGHVAIPSEQQAGPATPGQQARPATPWYVRLVQRLHRPWYVALARRLARPSAWALTLLVGSLLVPAITKQWSDRQEELSIKTSLVTDISESATTAVNKERIIVSGVLPETQVRQRVETLYQQARGADKQKRKQQLEAAEQAETRAKQVFHNDNYYPWAAKGAVIQAKLDAYFPNSKIAADWRAYVQLIKDYIVLGSSDCGSIRATVVERIRGYLHEEPGTKWETLKKPTADPNCRKAWTPGFTSTYYYLGDPMLKPLEPLLRGITGSQISGFSRGWGDLVRDVLSK